MVLDCLQTSSSIGEGTWRGQLATIFILQLTRDRSNGWTVNCSSGCVICLEDFREGDRSITGYFTLLGDSPLSWKTKKQMIVSRLPAEAEYRSITAVTSELLWLRALL